MRVLLILCLLLSLRGDADAKGNRNVIGYRNGRALKLKVTEIHRAQVEVRTARAFLDMREAAKRAGIDLIVWSGFRTNQRQAALYRAYRRGHGNLAARPGHSNHQSGTALDLLIPDRRTFAWLKKHAQRFGFRRTVKSEPWHWDYSPVRVRRRR